MQSKTEVEGPTRSVFVITPDRNNHFVYDILTAAPRHCCTVNHFSDCKRHRIFDQFRALQPSDVLDPEGELLKRIILRELTPLS